MTWEDAPAPGRLRRWLLPAAIGVAVVALGAAALAPRTDERGVLAIGPTAAPADSADAAGPSALPAVPMDPMEVTSEIPGRGDLLPGAPALTVVAGRREHLALIDIATGSVRQVQLPRSSRPPPGLGAMFTSGPDLIINHHGTVLRIAGGDGRLSQMAEGQRAVPSHDSDDGSIWMTNGMMSAVAATAVRVAADGTVLERVQLPAIARPVSGTADGLIVSAPGGISMVSAGGAEEITAAGELVASDGERIAWVDCESGVRCAVVLGTVGDPDQGRLALRRQDVPAGYFGLPTGAFSPDGRWLAFPLYRINDSGTLERPWISIVDTASASEVFRVQGPFTQAFSALPLAWSPDSGWLFVASRDGITAWDTASGQATRLDLDIEPPRGLAVVSTGAPAR